MIEVTGVDLVKFAQKAYALSVPQGMGFLHFTSGPLSDADARECLRDDRLALAMDYVHGRACKLNVFKEGDGLFINDSWYDHADAQLAELLSEFGIAAPPPADHGVACECRNCRKSRIGHGE